MRLKMCALNSRGNGAPNQRILAWGKCRQRNVCRLQGVSRPRKSHSCWSWSLSLVIWLLAARNKWRQNCIQRRHTSLSKSDKLRVEQQSFDSRSNPWRRSWKGRVNEKAHHYITSDGNRIKNEHLAHNPYSFQPEIPEDCRDFRQTYSKQSFDSIRPHASNN